MSFVIQTLLLFATATQFLVPQAGVHSSSGMIGRDLCHAVLPAAEVAFESVESEFEAFSLPLHLDSEPAGNCANVWQLVCAISDPHIRSVFFADSIPRGPPA